MKDKLIKEEPYRQGEDENTRKMNTTEEYGEKGV